MNRQRYKKLKESDILEVTQELCATSKNKTTSTLDIKQHLRQQGFYALQADVSMLMDRLNDNGVVTWVESGGGYRIYSLTNQQQNTQQDVLNTSVSITPSNDIKDTPKKTYKIGDWTCRVGTFDSTTYVNQNITRSQARWKYAKGIDVIKFRDFTYPTFDHLTDSQIRDEIYRQTRACQVS